MPEYTTTNLPFGYFLWLFKTAKKRNSFSLILYLKFQKRKSFFPFQHLYRTYFDIYIHHKRKKKKENYNLKIKQIHTHTHPQKHYFYNFRKSHRNKRVKVFLNCRLASA
jgi:hypothetical protein